MGKKTAGAANEDAKLLMSMTGIEAFTAMLLASEIGDITRFVHTQVAKATWLK